MSTANQADCMIGFDVGGTTLKAALVSEGKIIETLTQPTLADAEAEATIENMVALIEQLKAKSQSPVKGVGMGMAGLIDGPAGVVVTSPNLPRWKNVKLAEILQTKVALSVALDNDVRAMALGELAYGAGRGAKNLLCMTIGTGVGSAIIIDGQIYRGASLSAGELGHVMVVPQGGRSCGCGNWGCLETVAGTPGILSLAERFIERGLSPYLAKAVQHQELTPKLIFEAAQAGDPGASELWQEVGQWIGIALAGVVNFINPERIVIGGGISQAGEFLFEPLRRAIQRHAFERPAQAVTVCQAELGSDAGMIGSAVMAQKGAQA